MGWKFKILGLLFGQKNTSDSWKNGVGPNLSKKSGGVKPGCLQEGGPKIRMAKNECGAKLDIFKISQSSTFAEWFGNLKCDTIVTGNLHCLRCPQVRHYSSSPDVVIYDAVALHHQCLVGQLSLQTISSNLTNTWFNDLGWTWRRDDSFHTSFKTDSSQRSHAPWCVKYWQSPVEPLRSSSPLGSLVFVHRNVHWIKMWTCGTQ